MKQWHTRGCRMFRVCSGEVWEREGGCRKWWACVSLCVCVCCVCVCACKSASYLCASVRVCVCVQSSDCQCCTTVQVEQCRVISDTEGQRGGGREVVRETWGGGGGRGSEGERWEGMMQEERGEQEEDRLWIQIRKAGEAGSFCRWISDTRGFLQPNHLDLSCPLLIFSLSLTLSPSPPTGTLGGGRRWLLEMTGVKEEEDRWGNTVSREWWRQERNIVAEDRAEWKCCRAENGK